MGQEKDLKKKEQPDDPEMIRQIEMLQEWEMFVMIKELKLLKKPKAEEKGKP